MPFHLLWLRSQAATVGKTYLLHLVAHLLFINKPTPLQLCSRYCYLGVLVTSWFFIIRQLRYKIFLNNLWGFIRLGFYKISRSRYGVLPSPLLPPCLFNRSGLGFGRSAVA